MKKSIVYLYAAVVVFCIPSAVYWYDSIGGLDNVTPLNLFPLFGLLAFTIMWTHLMVAGLKRLKPKLFDYRTYFRQTSNLVLALILLHPGLLIYHAAINNYSLLDYVAPDNRVFIYFGTVAFLIFIAYEFFDRLRENKVIKDNWQYIAAFNRIGFVLVFIHGLQLGQHLQSGFLRGLWLFYGITALIYFVWAYSQEIRRDRATHR